MISRRRLIGGAIAVIGSGSAASILAGCGSDEPTTQLANLNVVQRFPQMLVPGEVRAPISLADVDGVVTVARAASIPATLTARLLNAQTGDLVVEGISATRHDEGLEAPYWPFRFTVDDPGIYTLIVDGAQDTGAAVQVSERTAILVPLVGDPLPGFDTPTLDNPRGVDPICTRSPEPCPMHDVTLTEALALGKPVAYLVGTPAYCSTGTCSPAIEGLLAVRDRVGDAMTFVHAEIYTDSTVSTVAPAVTALNMTYEPALYITDATGTLVERLDAVFDAREINEVLARYALA
jgi:hypothetical protein